MTDYVRGPWFVVSLFRFCSKDENKPTKKPSITRQLLSQSRLGYCSYLKKILLNIIVVFSGYIRKRATINHSISRSMLLLPRAGCSMINSNFTPKSEVMLLYDHHEDTRAQSKTKPNVSNEFFSSSGWQWDQYIYDKGVKKKIH